MLFLVSKPDDLWVKCEHKISDNFLLENLFLKMTERPFTQKSSFGQESVNTIFGLFSAEVPFLTRLRMVAKFRYRCAFKPFC
jgi:hypothetical protein